MLRALFDTVAIAAVTLTASIAGAELLTNPDFEDTGGGIGEGWGSFGNADFNDFFGGNGHASLFMDNPGNFGGVFQSVGGAVPGATYTFSLLDVRIEENAAADLRFGLEYYAADDSTATGPFDIVPIPLSPTGDGLSFTMSGVAPAGTAIVRPIILFDNVTSTANGQENAFVFSTSLVPEPASLGLVGLGGLALLGRRSTR